MEKNKFFEDLIVRNVSKEDKHKMRVIKIKYGITFARQVRSALSMYFKTFEKI